MERREFLRRSILAAIGITVAAPLIEGVEVDQAWRTDGRKFIKQAYERAPNAKKMGYTFRVSNELLQDKEAFYSLLLESRIPNNVPYTMEVGHVANEYYNDFLNNTVTVKLTYYV